MIMTLIIITVSLAVIITVNHDHNGRHITAVSLVETYNITAAGFSLPRIINISQCTLTLRLNWHQ